MGSEYRGEQLGNGRTRFIVVPAPVPTLSLGPAVLGGIAGLIVLLGFSGQGSLVRSLLAATGASVLGWSVYSAARRRLARHIDRCRSPGGSFIASLSGIELPTGTAIPRDQLHGVSVRNGLPSHQGTAVTVPYAPGLNSAGTSVDGPKAGPWSRAASVSYLLCAEHDGRSTTLAGGMTEATAFGLLEEAGRILKLTAPSTPDDTGRGGLW